MFLGIEIGGSKLQLAVGSGTGPPLIDLQRAVVEPQLGAQAIRDQIQRLASQLLERHDVHAVGVGFGGPVDPDSGRTITSHQVDGWDDFPLADWCRRALGLPAVLANDSDCAGVAEARFGAGQGARVVFYTNAGSGIGGALVIDGQPYRGVRGVAAEIGHLRPGLDCDRPDRTIESIASGWGIAAAARARLEEDPSNPHAADLLAQCRGNLDRLNAKRIAQAASQENPLAREIFDHASRVYAWGIAQMVTLLAPDVVVLGGGVSLAGETLWLAPVRNYVTQYVFPPLAGTFQILPADLSEEVVLHGALALAANHPPP